jgi:acylphosphatase
VAREAEGSGRRQARRLLVRGRVQGVFFRDELSRRAERDGVAGWVANRDDGAVEAWLEGDPDAVERLVEWAREGPARARVEDVAVERVRPRGLAHFDVR